MQARKYTQAPYTQAHTRTREPPPPLTHNHLIHALSYQRPTLTTMSNESWSMCNLHAVRSCDDPAVVENTSTTVVSKTLQYDTNLPWPGMLYCLRTTNNAREFMLYRRHPALVRNCKPTSTTFLWWWQLYYMFALYRTEQIISSSSDTAHTPRVGNHDTPFPTITVLLFSFLTRLLSVQILILCQPLSLSPSICPVVTRCSRFLFLNTWPMNYVFVSSDFAHDLPFMVCCSYIYYSQIVYWPNLCLV